MIQIRDEAETQALFLSTSGQVPPGTQNGQAAIPEALRKEIQIMEALRGGGSQCCHYRGLPSEEGLILHYAVRPDGTAQQFPADDGRKAKKSLAVYHS